MGNVGGRQTFADRPESFYLNLFVTKHLEYGRRFLHNNPGKKSAKLVQIFFWSKMNRQTYFVCKMAEQIPGPNLRFIPKWLEAVIRFAGRTTFRHYRDKSGADKLRFLTISLDETGNNQQWIYRGIYLILTWK